MWRKIKLSVRITAVLIKNTAVFLSVVIPRGIVPWRWAWYWRELDKLHQQRVRRMLTELTMSGEIKRRMVDGEFRYYPMGGDENKS